MTRCEHGDGGCDLAAVAIRTTRPRSSDLRTTVYYDPEAAPKSASRYCRSCARKLLAELVSLLGEPGTAIPPTEGN